MGVQGTLLKHCTISPVCTYCSLYCHKLDCTLIVPRVSQQPLGQKKKNHGLRRGRVNTQSYVHELKSNTKYVLDTSDSLIFQRIILQKGQIFTGPPTAIRMCFGVLWYERMLCSMCELFQWTSFLQILSQSIICCYIFHILFHQRKPDRHADIELTENR